MKPTIVICESDGIPSTAISVSTFGETAYPWIGGSGNIGIQKKDNSTYLTHWEIIKLIKELGSSRYDLAGCNPEKVPQTYFFKARMCGKDPVIYKSVGIMDACESPLSKIIVLSGIYLQQKLQKLKNRMDAKLCMDTTLLVNFESSQHAVDMAIATNRKKNVGIHINLTEGIPLTSKIKKESLFCNNKGLFHYKKDKRILHLSTSEKIAVYEEITAQIQKCRSLGIPISHADSHNHIHEEPGVFFLFLKVLKKENIPFLRLTRNMGRTSLVNKICRNCCNTILSFNNLKGSNYFGSIPDLIESRKSIKINSIVELMIHPGLIKGDQIFDIYSNNNLSKELSEIINDNILISYTQIL